jgi:hypothetical protein
MHLRFSLDMTVATVMRVKLCGGQPRHMLAVHENAELEVTEDNQKDDGERLLERNFRWMSTFH